MRVIGIQKRSRRSRGKEDQPHYHLTELPFRIVENAHHLYDLLSQGHACRLYNAVLTTSVPKLTFT